VPGLHPSLISKREEADSALRKDMFVSIIQSFLRADSTSIDDRLLKLELLAYNFHESLNLKPLFFQSSGMPSNPAGRRGTNCGPAEQGGAGSDPKGDGGAGRGGKILRAHRRFRRSRPQSRGIPLEPAMLTLNKVEPQFRARGKESGCRAKADADPAGGKDPERGERRISDRRRRVLGRLLRFPHDRPCPALPRPAVRGHPEKLSAEESARIAAVYFPGAYASLKEKPYVQEMVKTLLQTNKPVEGAGR